jgi:hypothetical protein
LQSQPFQLLALLLERPGQLVTRRLEDASRDCAWVTLVLYRKRTAGRFRLAWTSEFAFDTAV